MSDEIFVNQSVIKNEISVNQTGSFVLSVNGMVGNVVITPSTIGLGSVDNTSDWRKPISNATLTALLLKTDLSLYYTLNNLVTSNYRSWNSVYSYVNTNSAIESKATTFVLNNSSNIIAVDSLVNSTSANWNSVYSYVNVNSGIEVNQQAATTFVLNNSSNIIAVDSLVNSTSADWDTAYRSVSTTNALYLSGIYWNSVYSYVNTNSGIESNQQAATTFILNNSSNIVNVDTKVINTSANWDSVYSTVFQSSAAYLERFIYGTLNQIETIATPNNSVTIRLPNSIVTPGNLTVRGNLVVTGSAINLNTLNLTLSDSLIYLAEGNLTNAVDIGFIGSFAPQVSSYQHTGLVRIAKDNKWLLFSGVSAEPTTIVNLASGYVLDTLQANIEGNYGIFSSVSALSLSGVFYGDGSNLIGASLPGQSDINTLVRGNSGSWNNAYAIGTTYQNTSGSFATNTALNAASSVLLPISVYQNTSGSFATNTALYAASSVLLPTSIYQNTSGSFATNTALNAASSILLPISVYQNTSGSFATNTALNAASSILLPISVYQNTSGSFATNTALYTASSVLLPTSIYQNTSGSFVTYTVLNATSSVLLPISIYQNTSGSFATNTALNAASSLLLPTSIYQNASGVWQNAYQRVSANNLYLNANTTSLSAPGAFLSVQTLSATNNVIGYNLTVSSQIQFLTGSNFVKVYQFYNSTTNSIDTVFN